MKNILKAFVFLMNLALLIALFLLVKSEFDASANVEQTNSVVEQDTSETDILEVLNREHVSLFQTSNLSEDYKEGTVLDTSSVIKKNDAMLSFDDVLKIKEGFYAASGWFHLSEEKGYDYVLFTDEKHQVVGAALYGLNRKGLSEAISKKNADNSGWGGYFSSSSDQKTVYAYGKTKEDEGYIYFGEQTIQ